MIDYKATLTKIHEALPELTIDDAVKIFNSIVLVEPDWKPCPPPRI
jgi:hypothetical protein